MTDYDEGCWGRCG